MAFRNSDSTWLPALRILAVCTKQRLLASAASIEEHGTTKVDFFKHLWRLSSLFYLKRLLISVMEDCWNSTWRPMFPAPVCFLSWSVLLSFITFLHLHYLDHWLIKLPPYLVAPLSFTHSYRLFILLHNQLLSQWHHHPQSASPSLRLTSPSLTQ